MGDPNIIFVGVHDHANLCNRIARALNRHVGRQIARVATTQRHPFGYAEDLVVQDDASYLEMVDLLKHADWIVSTGDGNYDAFEACVKGAREMRRSDHPLKIALTHAGSTYRLTPDFYERADAALGARVRFIGCDSLYLAAGSVPAVPYFGTTDLGPYPWARFSVERTLRVVHAPSNRSSKGTEIILPVLEQLRVVYGNRDFAYTLVEKMGFNEAAAARRSAHVYINQMNPEVGGFGQAAIEALGMGQVVLADMRFVSPAVADFFPPPPIVDVRDAEGLTRVLRTLYRQPRELQRLRELSWEWASKYASDEGVASYWLRILKEHA